MHMSTTSLMMVEPPGCGIHDVIHGITTVAESGSLAVTVCVDGYHHIAGDLIRKCNHTGTWSGMTPVCGDKFAMTSVQIAVFIAGPIMFFFLICISIDFYFFKKRRSAMREQQGRVYHDKLRRVGIAHGNMGSTFHQSDASNHVNHPKTARMISTWKTMLNLFSFRRRVGSLVLQSSNTAKHTVPIESQDTATNGNINRDVNHLGINGGQRERLECLDGGIETPVLYNGSSPDVIHPEQRMVMSCQTDDQGGKDKKLTVQTIPTVTLQHDRKHFKKNPKDNQIRPEES